LLDEISTIGEAVVTAPKFGFWRDGYIAFHTARSLGASHVRLIAEPQPDFAVCIGNDEFLYEATELLKPERKRHDEYRATAASGNPTQNDPQENWVTEPDFLGALLNSATSKSLKNYPLGCRLVIYVNVGWINSSKSIAAPLIDVFGLQALQDAVHPASAKFQQISLLHREALVTL
jgi:hypothetical protein